MSSSVVKLSGLALYTANIKTSGQMLYYALPTIIVQILCPQARHIIKKLPGGGDH